MIKPPYYGNGRLTPGVFKLLQTMATEGDEAVQERTAVWVDLHRFHSATLHNALQLCALRDVSDDTGTLRRFVLNEVGHAILNDPAQADKVVTLLTMGRNMTVKDGKVVELV